VVVLALLGVGLPAPGAAQEPPTPLGLSEVYRALDETSPRIRAARAAATASEARIGRARRPPDPELQFGLMNRELPGFAPDDPLGMNQIQLMQMIPIAGKLRLAGQVARAQAASADQRAQEVRWEQRARAAMAFYELYQTDQSLVVALGTQRLLRDLARTAETMYAVGEGRQADVLRAQVEAARMTEEIVRMEAMRSSAAARLNALLDRPPETVVPSPVLPAFPPALPARDSLERLADGNRPMIKAGAEDLRAAESAVVLARREIWPDLQVGVQYGWIGMEGETDHMLSLMLGFQVPIWAGSRQLAARREMEAMREMAIADLAGMRADTRGRVGELLADIGQGETLGRLYRTTVLPQADANVASALSAYRVGGVDFMTILEAQMSVNRYRQELFRIEAARGRALAELEMLTGTELMDPDDAPGRAIPGGDR
jgi:outer membrane protein TolC